MKLRCCDEAQTIAVAVFNFKIAIAMFLITNSARDLYAFLLIFVVQRIGIINP